MKTARTRALLWILAGVLSSTLILPISVEGQAPFLVYGSSGGVAQVIKSTSNALWVSIQSGSAVPGSGLFFASQAIGDLIVADSTTTFTRLAIGASNALLFSNGTTSVWKVNAQTQTGGFAPTGSSDATGLMMGMGSSSVITPTGSGRVVITVAGRVTTTTTAAAAQCTVTGKYGTGTAPANQAAITGTTFGTAAIADVDVITVAGFTMPFSITAVLPGLTLNTAYWADVAVASASGTCSIAAAVTLVEQ